MNFDEAEKYLLSLGNEVSAMKLGLENIRKLIAALGDPHEEYLKVQVAGTNGKGSVCAFLNSICLGAGIRTGMYTSPHLVSITERVQIDGVDISEDEFARFATRVRDLSESLFADGAIESVPTYFEQVTAIALIAFAEAKVELAILETGLGGRLDATTAAKAEVAAITRIDLDHQKYLGETLDEIAAEKAAIIHRGSKVVIGEQQPDAMKVLLERCHQVEVEPRLATALVVPAPLGLPGRHQVENANVAAATADVLREYFLIRVEHIAAGLATARHPGRLEFDGRFLFDGAHNVAGAKALRAYLDEFVKQPIRMIFASMDDKDVNEIASILFPKADTLILTRPDNWRAVSPDELLKAVPDVVERKRVFLADNAEEAVAKALEASTEEGLILVTGSLYLVGEIQEILTVTAE